MSQSPPNVLAILPSTIASCIILVVKPLSALADKRLIRLKIVLEREVSISQIERADVIVFCRNTEPAYGNVLDTALALGKPIIFDLDDNFWEIPLGHDPELASYHRMPFRLQQLEKYLVHADLVRVYSPVMLELISKLNSNVKLVKAGVDFRLLPRVAPRKRNDGVIHVVYATSRIVDAQYHLFLSATKEILKKFPNSIELSIWGCQPQDLVGHSEVKIFPLISKYEDFLKMFEKTRFDVGLAPLEHTLFNRCKSNTKYRDYGACRIAGIYSNVDVYSNSVVHEKTGMLVDDNHESWRDALIRLIFEHKLREDIQEAAYKDVNENYRLEIIEQEFLNEILQMVMTRHQAKGRINGSIKEIKVRTPEGYWTGITLPLSDTNPGSDHVKLRLEVLTSSGSKLRQASTTMCKLEKRDRVTFEFQAIANSFERDFILRMVDMGRVPAIKHFADVQFDFSQSNRKPQKALDLTEPKPSSV